jgi:hypothetical protein
MTEILERTLDARVAPTWIVDGHLDHEPPDFTLPVPVRNAVPLESIEVAVSSGSNSAASSRFSKWLIAARYVELIRFSSTSRAL